MRISSGFGISNLVSTFSLMLGAFAISTAEAGVPLDSYVEGAPPPSEIVSGFTLAFDGDLDHVVQFHLSPSPALLVRTDLTFPNGGSTRQERYLEASAGPRQVSFGLGPLLGHGPWLHRPRQFYPGEYTLRISGRDPATREILFKALFRLPPQEWIWADLDRLLYIDDAQAGLDLKLLPGALADELPAVVDLVEPLTGQRVAEPVRVSLTRRNTRVTFSLEDLLPGTYQARVRIPRAGEVSADGVARTLQLFRNGPAPRLGDAAKIGDGPQLLVDDYLVAESRGLRKVFHPARKVTDGPILSPDRPYEGHSILLDNSARYNPEENRYELTYRHVNYDEFRYHMLAVSHDLRTWTKPDLGRVEHDGSRANNILARMDVTKPGDLFPVFAGVWDYARRGNPDLRRARLWLFTGRQTSDRWALSRGYYLVVWDQDGKSYVTSPTPVFGLGQGGTETMSVSGDTSAAMGYDGATGEFVAYTSPGPPNRGRGRIRYDNSTKARTLARHVTRDGINWEARYLWVPEVSDPNLHNYGFRVRKLGDSYLGFFPRYNVRTQHMDLQLWVSRNGIHWEQPGGEQAWLANGPPGSFDWGIVYMPAGWHQQGERTRIFYHGTNYLHFHAWIREKLSGLYSGMGGKDAPGLLGEESFVERAYLAPPSTRGHVWSLMPSGWSWRQGTYGTVQEARNRFWAALTANTGESPETFVARGREFRIAPGLAEFRTNGFLSRRADRDVGVLTTHPLVFQGRILTVNAQVSHGELGVEVLDRDGSPLKGYARDDCILPNFDAVQQTVRWKDHEDLGELAGRPVRLRFYLRQGDFYAFQIHHAEPAADELIEPFPGSEFMSF
jgi:hypothetical protein